MRENPPDKFLERALLLTQLGFYVTPLEGKAPIGSEWPDTATKDEAQLRAWNKKYPNANVGIVANRDKADGTWSVDFDDIAWFGENISARLGEFFKAPPCWARTGSGSDHIHFLHDEYSRAVLENLKLGPLELGGKNRFEIKAHRTQCVGPGSIHPETKKPYTWRNQVAPLPAPREFVDFLLAFLKKTEAKNEGVGPWTPEVMESLLGKCGLSTSRIKIGKNYRWRIGKCFRTAEHPESYVYLTDGWPGFNCWHDGASHPGELHWKDFQQHYADKLKDFPWPHRGIRATITTERFSQIKAQTILWLIKNYLPLGVLVTLFAAKGRGKTKICDWFTAIVTKQGFRVQRFNLEDPKQQVHKPALYLAGANLDLVERVNRHATIEKDGKTLKTKISFADQEFIDALIVLIQERPDTRLVVIEPVNNYKGTRAKAISEDDMRPIYDSLADVAEKTGVCILAVNHTNKKKDVDPLEKSYGASSGVNVARVNFQVETNPNDKSERWLMDAGSNLPIGPTKVFKIVEQPPFEMDGETIEGIAIAVFERDDSTINAPEAVEEVESTRQGESKRIAAFLTEFLDGKGEMLKSAVIEAARRYNSNWTPDNITQVFSRKKIGTSDTPGFGPNKKTYWSLDKQDSINPAVPPEQAAKVNEAMQKLKEKTV